MGSLRRIAIAGALLAWGAGCGGQSGEPAPYLERVECTTLLEITVETGGARFTTTVPAHVSATIDGTVATKASQWNIAWDDLCGDVSSSKDWQKLRDEDSPATLCVDAEVQLWDGPPAISAEVAWQGASQLWAYWNRVTPE
jgi:hypothetical protein